MISSVDFVDSVHFVGSADSIDFINSVDSVYSSMKFLENLELMVISDLPLPQINLSIGVFYQCFYFLMFFSFWVGFEFIFTYSFISISIWLWCL